MDNTLMHSTIQTAISSLLFSSSNGELKYLHNYLKLEDNILSVQPRPSSFQLCLENLEHLSIQQYNLPLPPYMGFRHLEKQWRPRYDINTICTFYFQRNENLIYTATCSIGNCWEIDNCDCDGEFGCMDDCPARSTIINTCEEKQLDGRAIIEILANDPSFMDVLLYLFNPIRTIQTLINAGHEIGMTFFNPCTFFNSISYYDQHLCIVCHNPVESIVMFNKKTRKNRSRTLVRCHNQYCIQVGKNYCNYLKTSISNSCINVPDVCVRIILFYLTSLNNSRTTRDSDVVGDEFPIVGKFIVLQ
jgi:hypothetical protein